MTDKIFIFPDSDQVERTNLKPLSPLRQSILLDLDSISHRRHENHIKQIADAAHAAVEQVQEKRIEMLETGPYVTVSDIFLDVMLSVLITAAISKIISKALTAVTNDILRHRALFKILPRTELGNEVIWDLSTDALSAVEQNYELKYLLKTSDVKELYHENVFKFLDQVPPTVGALVKLMDTHDTRYSEADASGVTILDSINSFKRNQLQAIDRTHDCMRICIQIGYGTEDFWKQLKQKLIRDNEEQKILSNEEYDVLKRQFEVLIWLNTYNIQLRWESMRRFVFVGLPNEFRDYFLKRAPDPRSKIGASYYHYEKARRGVSDENEKGQADNIIFNAASHFNQDLPILQKKMAEVLVKQVKISKPQKVKNILGGIFP